MTGMKWSIPEKIIALGRSYLQEGRVLSANQDVQRRVWHAEVLGQKMYHVTLDGTAKEQDICECPYWLEHGYCKHTVAVELFLREKGLTRMIEQTVDNPITISSFSMAEMFTKGFSKLRTTDLTSTLNELALEYTIESIATNDYYPELAFLALSIRLGYRKTKTKFYRVKNIGEFLQTYQKENMFLVNKQYTFQLNQEAFVAEDQKLLSLLVEIYQTTLLMGKSSVQVNGKLDKRYLMLPIDQAKFILEQMSQRPFFSLILESQKQKQIQFVQEQLPIEISLNKESKTSYRLTIENQLTAFLEYYQWGISKNKIYLVTSEQVKIYLTLLQLLKRMDKPEIVYPKEELSELFTFVIPHLKKIGSVKINEDIQTEIVQASLQIIFILRKLRGKIDVRVDFCYGDTVYSTNVKHTKVPSETFQVIRDKMKEQQVFDILTDLGYEKNESGFDKTIPQKKSLYVFFKQEIPNLRKLGEVKMGKKLRELFLDAQTHQPTIEVSDADSWLDIRFDVTGIAEQEVEAVLNSLLRNEDFYTLQTGEILSFDSEEFRQTNEVLTALGKKAKLSHQIVQLPKNQGLMLENMLEKNQQVLLSSSFQQMVFDFTHPEDFDVMIPQGLQATLRPYQIIGFKWMKMLSYYQLGGILADEMGLGKTLQTITYLLSEKEEGSFKGKALIVAPASLIYNWKAELKKFAPNLVGGVIAGNKNERENLLIHSQFDVLITSYTSLRQDIQLYQSLEIDYLILDEAQMVKNSTTKTAQALKQLRVTKRFALSGTPIENNLDELWSLFQLILPGLFPTKVIFRGMAPEEIAKMIRPFILRREKKFVLDDLPEKIESNIYSSLTEEQKTIYLAYLKKMQEDVQAMNQKSFQKNRLSILAGLTRLRQICCDPSLFMDEYQGGSGKLEQVKELLMNAKENKRRVLLFSQFTSMLSIIEKELQEIGISTFYLRGSTQPKQRLKMVEAFNHGEKDVFLISLKAGGTGLNLTGGDTVILYDLWWNPAVEEQAAGRAHRIGQKNVVEVWRMIAEGTIEEKMNILQNEKRELFQKVMQGNQEQLAKLTEADIRNILSIGEVNEEKN